VKQSLGKKLKQKLRTFATKPNKAFVKYFKMIVLRQILPYYGEDYDKHWGFTVFRNKVVLDVGADYGSTAYYFLKRKATAVIAVEGNVELWNGLMRHYGNKRNVCCVFKMIASSGDFEELLKQFHVDVAKVDIEGAEAFIVGVPPKLIIDCPEWLIETHSSEIATKLEDHFLSLLFNVSMLDYSDGSTLNKILYAKRKT
jgi:hypothetical protein